MNALKPLCKLTTYSYQSSLLPNYSTDNAPTCKNVIFRSSSSKRRSKFAVLRASSVDGSSERRSFLTLEEAGLVEMSGLSSHERFLCRLTISSLNLLRVISEQEGSSIEELNAGKVCDWFMKDKLKREQNLDPVLQWDESEFSL